MNDPRPPDERATPEPAWSFRSLLVLAMFLVLCFVVAAIGGNVTTPEIGGWYATLAKPSFNPPAWIFGPVWSLLYTMMAFAGWLVWRADPAMRKNRGALLLFLLQLAFNLAWSVAFFGMHSPLFGLFVIVPLEILIIATALAFAKFDRIAAWLLVPYAAWVAFAMLLNIAIYRLN